MERVLPSLGFILTLAFIPWLSSGATTPRWSLLSAAVPLLLLLTPLHPTRAHWLMLGGLLYSALSLLWMTVPLDGVHGLWILAICCGVFCVGAEARTLEPLLKAMSVGVTLTLPLALAQVLGSAIVPQTAPPGGLFFNTNILGETCAALLVACFYMRAWKLVPGLVLGVLLTRDRTGLVMLLAATIFYMWHRRILLKPLPLLFLAVLLTAGVFMTWQKNPTFTNIGQDRVAIWKDTTLGMTLMGNGIGSFWTEYPRAATHTDTALERAEFAHSEPLHFVFELGVGSLFLFAALAWSLGGKYAPELETGILVAILAASCLAFPLHMPVTAFLGFLVAGRLAGVRCRYELAQSFGGVFNGERSERFINEARAARRIVGGCAYGDLVSAVGPQPAEAACDLGSGYELRDAGGRRAIRD